MITLKYEYKLLCKLKSLTNGVFHTLFLIFNAMQNVSDIDIHRDVRTTFTKIKIKRIGRTK